MNDHSDSPFLYGYDEVSKAKQKEASTGRKVLGATLGPYHGAVAGKKGHKLRAMGNQLAGGFAGSVGGSLVGSVVTRGNPHGTAIGSGIGSMAGSLAGTNRAQRMGHFKREK